MFMRLMRGIGIFYYWTWLIWPFVFTFSLAYGISALIKEHEDARTLITIAAISLLIILAGISSAFFM